MHVLLPPSNHIVPVVHWFLTDASQDSAPHVCIVTPAYGTTLADWSATAHARSLREDEWLLLLLQLLSPLVFLADHGVDHGNVSVSARPRPRAFVRRALASHFPGCAMRGVVAAQLTSYWLDVDGWWRLGGFDGAHMCGSAVQRQLTAAAAAPSARPGSGDFAAFRAMAAGLLAALHLLRDGDAVCPDWAPATRALVAHLLGTSRGAVDDAVTDAAHAWSLVAVLLFGPRAATDSDSLEDWLLHARADALLAHSDEQVRIRGAARPQSRC